MNPNNLHLPAATSSTPNKCHSILMCDPPPLFQVSALAFFFHWSLSPRGCVPSLKGATGDHAAAAQTNEVPGYARPTACNVLQAASRMWRNSSALLLHKLKQHFTTETQQQSLCLVKPSHYCFVCWRQSATSRASAGGSNDISPYKHTWSGVYLQHWQHAWLFCLYVYSVPPGQSCTAGYHQGFLTGLSNGLKCGLGSG